MLIEAGVLMMLQVLLCPSKAFLELSEIKHKAWSWGIKLALPNYFTAAYGTKSKKPKMKRVRSGSSCIVSTSTREHEST